jgi:hypothetical protein
MAAEQNVRLLPHPSTPQGAVRGIGVAVRREAGSRLRLCYRLEGDPRRLRLPPPAAATFALNLWEHTCFEAFIAVEGSSAYHELNLSPSGEWAVFGFSEYREIAEVDIEGEAPGIAVRIGADTVELEAVIDLAAMAAGRGRPALPIAALRLGLSAVVESEDGAFSYWSLVHLPGAPDFHHHETRTIELPAPLPGDS